MRRIRARDTVPELVLRGALFRSGLRYRCHDCRLPGQPDIVFAKFRTVVFVHGCFWHLHPGCRRGRIPVGNRAYWEPKLLGNVFRDRAVRRALRALGWRTIIAWECQILRGPELAAQRVRRALIKYDA